MLELSERDFKNGWEYDVKEANEKDGQYAWTDGKFQRKMEVVKSEKC
jgi:hypothetical protein